MAPARTAALLTELEARLEAARARGRRTLVSVTAEVEEPDPCAAVFAARLARDRWFCWEQPDRDFALAALGSAAEASSRGPQRFSEVGRRALEVMRDAETSDPAGLPAGAGPVWTGGFAFAAEGGSTPAWSSFDPAAMTLPEVSLVRRDGTTHLTVNVVQGASGAPDEVLRRISARLDGLGGASLPLLDPHRTERPRISGARAPGEFERSVEAATERIAAGEFDKVVLAREIVVSAGSAHDPAALFGALRELFPSCFCFCCGTPEAAFIGASPELLLRRSGAGLSTVGLAGSARRSSDPAVDDHLGEQLLRSDKDRREHAIVVRRIVRSLRRLAVWVETAPDPEIVKVANIQHLATPIVAQLADPRSAIELAGLLHPTPAVGGEPWPDAGAAIADLEGMDRGWYAGPVGWMDSAEDGEFCVALRSGLLRDRDAHLYAGVGIVAGSDPAAELAETEVKLGALMPLLS
jgi:isochorismate synthase